MKVLVNELRLEYEIQTRNVRRAQPAPAPKAAPPAQVKTPPAKATPQSDKNRGPGPSPLKFGSTPTNVLAEPYALRFSFFSFFLFFPSMSLAYEFVFCFCIRDENK